MEAVEQFFVDQSVDLPPSLQSDVDSFVSFHCQSNRPIALVTSGGTTVPLETNTVRFLDNFSGGNRGAASAESFLSRGYAVVFLHRRNSLQPYSRRVLVHTEDQIFDFIHLDESGSVSVRPEHKDRLHQLLLEHDQCVADRRLLKVGFTSIAEYLSLLRLLSVALQPAQTRALIYLAAAVSDFYLPNPATHKIQSSTGALDLHMPQVPKMISALKQVWAPSAFIVSFKLETDSKILESKARGALAKYKHQCVVANLLANYKERVLLYEGGGDKADGKPPTVVERGAAAADLEPKLIDILAQKHTQYQK